MVRAVSFASSVQKRVHGNGCQWECFKAFTTDGGESQEDVQGVEYCATLSGVCHSWVLVGVRCSLDSLGISPPS